MADKYKYRQVRRENEPPTFVLSTNDVKVFIQERVDLIVAMLRKKSEIYANLENIQVDVFGSRASDVYVPMMVILPPNVLRDETATMNENIPGIYFDRDEDSQLHLIKEINDFFRLYNFTKEDKKLFTTPSWLREKGMSTKVGQMIASFAEPRYRKQNDKDRDEDGQNTDMVMFFIDPIRIFHDMVMLEDENKKSYRISVTKIKKIRDGQYNYHVKKIYNGKNKKNRKNSFIREMDRMLLRTN